MMKASGYTLWCFQELFLLTIQASSAANHLGKQTTYSYSKNSVTKTEKGISTTRTKNAVGELVKVSDPSGEAVYHYRADGQLSDIMAPGNSRS